VNFNRFSEQWQREFAREDGFVLPEKYDRVEVGRRIKRLRQSQDITVQELAKRSTMSPGYISEVERGLSAISVDKLMQVAEGLGVGLETILEERPEGGQAQNVVQIPLALSAAADKLNLSHRATLTLLQGQRSLTARRSQTDPAEWSVDDWLKFYDQVKDYLPDC
jgi:transcriptional regulator with XRE-family HTH domain